MLSIGVLTPGKGFYYTELVREQYYTHGGEPPGRWYGEAAEQLGLQGEVTQDDLKHILEGFTPDGSKLVQNAGKEDRQAGLDLTFSADKSVSVLWAVGDSDTKQALQKAHSNAVDFALGYLEQEAAWTRRGHGGTDFEKCRLVFARFDHATSRAADPNMHTHVLVPNIGLRADGQTAALWNKEQYLHKMAAGAVYRAALAHELGPRGLGYELEADKERGFFRLASVPENVTEHFSKRRAQILAEVQEHGYSQSAKALDRANLATRSVKGHIARAELFVKWRSEARGLGFTSPSHPSRLADAPPSRGLSQDVRRSAEQLAERQAAFRPQDLVLKAAHHAVDGCTAPEKVLADAKRALGHEDTITVYEGKRHPLLTTKRQVRREDSLISVAKKLTQGSGRTVSQETVEQLATKRSRLLETKERRAALDHLTRTPGDLKILSGVAGTGKTSLLSVAREAWEAEGYRVIGTALAGRAARELQAGAGIETETIRKRQMQLEPTLCDQLKHHGRELARAAMYGTHKPSIDTKIQYGLEGLLRDGKWGRPPGYEPRKFDKLKLDSKTVVVIDESSMVSLRETQQMLRLAQRAGAKVVMVGDERQLPAIEAVSPFDALAAVTKPFELSEIQRQRGEDRAWMRHTVQALANGDLDTGLSLLKQNGSLHMSKGGPEATKDKLVADWYRAKGEVGDKIILTATNDDARDFNARAQKVRLAAGELGTVLSVTLGSGEKARVGDRILFNQNDRRLDVYNGELGTISRIHRPADLLGKGRGVVTVTMDHGKKARVDLTAFEEQTRRYAKNLRVRELAPSTSLGYALTTHKAQGSTVDRCFTYTTPATAARDMLYVQTSRAREEMAVYAPGHDLGEDLQDFKNALRRESGERELALQKGGHLAKEKALEEREKRELEEARDRARVLRRSRRLDS